jgi:exodeoxyribonuclease VII large subunit
MALTPDREALLEQLALTKSRLRAANASLVRTATRESRRSSARLRTLDPARPHAIALRNAAQAHRARARSRLTSMHLALERLAGRLASNKPESVHAERSSAVNRAASRLRRAVRARLDAEHLDRRHTRLASVARRELRDQRTALDALERELVLVSPASVLARGYSLTTRADTGTLVRTPADAHPGDRLVTRLGAGTLRSVVEGEGVTETAAPAPKLPPRRRRRTKRDTPGQMGLF